MESYNFEEPKNSSEEALRRWRSAVRIVKNPRRRFRMIADLAKRSEAEKKLKIQEKIRIASYVKNAALQFIEAGNLVEYKLSDETRQAGYGIDANELASIARGHDSNLLKTHGGVEGIANKVKVSLVAGENIPIVESCQEPAPSDMPSHTQETYNLSKEVIQAGFYIGPEKLESMVCNHNLLSLNEHKGVEGIARDLSVTLEDGVCPSQVSLRRQLYGSNQYTMKPSKSFLAFIWESLKNWNVITAMVCFVVSIVIDTLLAGPPMSIHGLGIIIYILFSVTAAVNDYKQFAQFKYMDKEKKIDVWVTRDRYVQKVSKCALVVGDIVHIDIGDQIPADGLFVSGSRLLIDDSSLTGANVNEANPFLLSGSMVQDGIGTMLVTSVGLRTEYGRFMQSMSALEEDKTSMQVKPNGVTVVAKIDLAFAAISFIALMISFLVKKGLHYWLFHDVLKVLSYVAIIAVPGGPACLVFALKQLMRNDNAFVRYLSACETMGFVSCICTDKTGTLTTNQMVVDKIWTCKEDHVIRGDNSRDATMSTLPKRVLNILLQCLFQNTSSEVVKGKDGRNTVLGTPTEAALLDFGLLLGGDFETIRQESKIVYFEPFDSTKTKMSVVVVLSTGGHRAICIGAPDVVIGMCNKIITSDGTPVELDAQLENVNAVASGYESEALRTLCLAFKDFDEKSNRYNIPGSGYTLIAIIGIKNPLRPGVKKHIQTFLSAGITLKMVSGDNIHTAKAVAKECGILTENGLAIEGSDFLCKSPQEMQEMIPRIQVVARSSPLTKSIFVTMLRNSEVVAVIGDGTNDAPALYLADIGFAMGITGTKVAKESADCLVLDDDFSTVVNVAKWGRALYLNIQDFVQFHLTVNVVALAINLVSVCLSGTAHLTAFQLLWVDKIVDILCALALSVRPPNDAIMKRPPVANGENIITGIMMRTILGQSIYQLVIVFVLEFCGKQILELSGSDGDAIVHTLIFNAFVFFQVFSRVNYGGINNKHGCWVFIGIIISVFTCQVIIVEFLGDFASTVSLSWQLWLFSVLIGSTNMVVVVVLNWIYGDVVLNPC